MASFLTALNDEFRRLSASPAARRAVRRWGDQFSALAGLHSPQEVLARRSGDVRLAPEVLKALAALASDDDLAARTLLHALMPGLAHLARTAGRGDGQAIDELVSLAWERIRTYPTSRQGSVAANVLLDVRKAYWHDRAIDRGVTAMPPPPDRAHARGPARSAEDEALAMVAIGQLVAARRRGVITEAAFGLIVRTRFAGIPMAEIAGELNVNPHRLVQRRYLAECRLVSDLRLAG